MESKLETRTVEELVELSKAGVAKVNPEYQRGEVWNLDQQKRLVDSVMRGYKLPVIYLHYKNREVAGMRQESYDIIDGQQRITALHRFAEGAFPLFEIDDPRAKFPNFLHGEPCDWGGKDIHALSDELTEHFHNAQIPVAFIETTNDNEVRDLFVRLQSGLPLNPQEKRDSYPGQFNNFVLSLGGKPELARYPGHPFFQRVLRMKPGQDRGKTRTLAAQIALLFLSQHNDSSGRLPDINARAIDEYYYTHLDFDETSRACRRLREILDKLDNLLGDRKGPALKAHEAIHLVLLLDTIWDDYTRSWEATLADAQDMFSAELAKSTKSARDGEPDETWLNYGIWTRSNSDRGDTIRRRHNHYSRRMREFLGNLSPKDPKRTFGSLERELVYWRDRKKCQVCDAEVNWDEAEIHHVEEHHRGGMTTLDNGALVHKHCHPKGAAAEEFWKARQQEASSVT